MTDDKHDIEEELDLLVVGAGPTGLAIGAEARRAGLDVLLVDRGALCAAIAAFPTDMRFFTTRDLLEIADVPFGIPDDKPDRRQALAYYHGVARRYEMPLALYTKVEEVRREGEHFAIRTRSRGEVAERRARAVALATGYFDQPKKLGVPGEELEWVSSRYFEPYGHFGQHVVVVGGGNTAAETALDLWRNGARVTLVHRRAEVKPSIKYWLRPDVENRLAEGSIAGRFETVVRAFREEGGVRTVELEGPEGLETLSADAAYVLIGYTPDADFERRCGIEVDPETLVPAHDPETCETNVPGLYVAGTIQAGRRTDKIFIENSRDHGQRIVHHLLERRNAPTEAEVSV